MSFIGNISRNLVSSVSLVSPQIAFRFYNGFQLLLPFEFELEFEFDFELLSVLLL